VQPRRLCTLQGILETLARATLAYGRRNVRMLYDALSTLAEAVGRGEWQRFVGRMYAVSLRDQLSQGLFEVVASMPSSMPLWRAAGVALTLALRPRTS
jgi:hypothetical protein